MKVLCAVLFVAAFADNAFAQCCCSGVTITVTDGSGVPIPSADLKISELGRGENSRVFFRDKDETEAKFNYKMGCASGRDVLMIESASSTMRVRFNFHGEFGQPKLDVVLTHGDHVAEKRREGEDENVVETIAIRPAHADEMKEIGSTPGEDVAANETAQDLRPLFEARGAFHSAGCDRGIWARASGLFSPYRNG